MIKQMEKAFIFTKMGLNMKGIGLRINKCFIYLKQNSLNFIYYNLLYLKNSMAKELRLGLMEQYIQALMKTAARMEKGNCNLQINRSTLDILRMIILKGKEFINGVMVDSMKENGNKIK